MFRLTTSSAISWTILALAGLAFIFAGTSIKHDGFADIASGMIYGIGIALFTTTLVKITLTTLEETIRENWRNSHIEIFGIKRSEIADKYEGENRKIQNCLQLLSISAGNALKDIDEKKTLYKAFTEKPAVIELLIVDPSSDTAKKKAAEDSPENIQHGLESIFAGFENLKETYDCILKSLGNSKICGRLEVRITDEPIDITIYNRDNEVLIYGHYFPSDRGDEYSAFRIRQDWNSEIYLQYNNHFLTRWSQASKKVLFVIGSKHPYFNDTLYDNICSDHHSKKKTNKDTT